MVMSARKVCAFSSVRVPGHSPATSARFSFFGISDSSDMATVVDQTPFQLDPPTSVLEDGSIITNPPVGASLFSPFTDLTGDPVEQIWSHVDNEFTWGSYETDSLSLRG